MEYGHAIHEYQIVEIVAGHHRLLLVLLVSNQLHINQLHVNQLHGSQLVDQRVSQVQLQNRLNHRVNHYGIATFKLHSG